MNLLQLFEKKQLNKLVANKVIPHFAVGDTVKVNVIISDEGANTRVQSYEGLVIARRSRGISSSFVVRKISYNEGVERKFLLYSPRLDSIEVVKRGIVRRAKLYYMRERRGKAARIEERKYVATDKKTVK